MAKLHTGFLCRRRDAINQLSAQGLQPRIDFLLAIAELLQGSDSGSHRQRIPRQRPRLIHRPQRRDQVHNLARPTVSAYRQPTANNLPHRRQIRTNVVQLLRPAEGQTKSRHHFIKNQHRPLALRNQTQRHQVIIGCRNTSHVSHNGLHNHACNLVLELVKRVLHRLHVVERQCHRELNKFFRNPR